MFDKEQANQLSFPAPCYIFYLEILMTDRSEPALSLEPQRRTQAADKPVTYYKKDYIPPKPTVTLLFEGLLWFLFHGKDECQIAIHNETSSAGHPHRHELHVQVWDKITGCGSGQSCGTPKEIPIGDMSEFDGIQIDVNRPDPAHKNVYVYLKERDEQGRPIKPDADWRWVTDFEKAPLFPNGIKLEAKDVNPGIWINHGLFYTLLKTTYEFELRKGLLGGTGPNVGNVALLVGGNIYLEKEGDVTLTVRRRYPAKPDIYTFPWAPDKCYQIDIRNMCRHCKPGHYGAWQNDFYLYNSTFTVPSGTPKPTYRLHRLGRRDQNAAKYLKFAQEVCVTKSAKEEIDSNNEAPCGPVCAGAGGGG